jgi:hypothetical protein
MGFGLLFHLIHTCPSFGGRKYQGASITAFGFNLWEHCISEHVNWFKCLYPSCRSFVQNCPERVGLRTVLTPHCVITFRVLWVVSKPIPKFLANVIASMPSCRSVTHTLETWTADHISVNRQCHHIMLERCQAESNCFDSHVQKLVAHSRGFGKLSTEDKSVVSGPLFAGADRS